jgi:hypothetical protein
MASQSGPGLGLRSDQPKRSSIMYDENSTSDTESTGSVDRICVVTKELLSQLVGTDLQNVHSLDLHLRDRYNI